MQTVTTLIRLGRCPGWSESSLGTQIILLVLPCCGSYSNNRYYTIKTVNNKGIDQTVMLLGWFVPLFFTNELPHDKTNKVTVRSAKTQISLGICPVWSESLLSAWRKLGSLATHWAHSEDSDQTGRMPRLIWVSTGRTRILLVWSRGSSNGINRFCHDEAHCQIIQDLIHIFFFPATFLSLVVSGNNMAWPHLQILWHGEDNSAGHIERSKKEKKTEEEMGR